MSNNVRPGKLHHSCCPGITFHQRFTPESAGLEFLSGGEFELPPQSQTRAFQFPGEESLLYQWRGESDAVVDGTPFHLAPYDILYVPLGASFRLSNPGLESSRILQTSAPAQHQHPVFHARFAELSKIESRIRRMKGKNVYLMFDVGEKADKLVAGYTFFEPHARSWPPHNHTDQEEAYIFIKGRGAMEVYESPETLSFVHSVDEGDIVTIPMLNYHPVFAQELPLEFIWCIAGERYWVGDKNKDFLKGSVSSVTT